MALLEDADIWNRQTLLTAMLSQGLGLCSTMLLPQKSVKFGALGHILMYAVTYIFVGVPLLYMEYVIGHFTGRNCLEVWKARPCFTHFGYLQIMYQLIHMIFCLTLASFALHYFFISLESPIPFYTCGNWSSTQCNILLRNYTVLKNCLNNRNVLPYCNDLPSTFPEYQYWRYRLVKLDIPGFYVDGHVTLCLGIISVLLILSCFKVHQTVIRVMQYCVAYILGTRLIFLIGSMLQKGVVVKFQEAMDDDFTLFTTYLNFPGCVIEMLFSLNVGSGISFNIASKGSFRSLCYSNTLIVVVITLAINIIAICNAGLMLCPYSYKFDMHPSNVMKYPLFLTYELFPRLISAYDSQLIWLLLTYSVIFVSLFASTFIILTSSMETVFRYNQLMAKHPRFTTAAVLLFLFIITIPFLGNKAMGVMINVQEGISLIAIYIILVECFNFMIFYGLGKFSEDVHFMSGCPPKRYVKYSWLLSVFVLMYVFVIELRSIYKDSHDGTGKLVCWWLAFTVIMGTMVLTIIRILKAVYEKRLRSEIELDPTWGPKSEVLRRSRAMFTAHAMTKEYIYRQYHLQAGIIERQKRSNIRATENIN